MQRRTVGTERSGSWTRREVLKAGATAGLALAGASAINADVLRKAAARRCIFIVCTGGPSQLETWDPKPEAPCEIRGPFGAVETNVPGIRISETLPRLARLADRYALVRTLHHDGPAIHELGLQLIQTGRGELDGEEWPHLSAAVGSGSAGRAPVILPRPLGDLGLAISRGQNCGALLHPHSSIPDSDETTLAPSTRSALNLAREPDAVRERYGRTPFGESCLRARRLVESGVPFVTVNQFDTIFNQHTWDCHGLPDLPTRVSDLRDEVAAPFDLAVSALIGDLCDRGLYEDTMVVCIGEFGRTPRLNAAGGRDHWNRCWSAMLGGGGLQGGRVVGASDHHAAEPVESPIRAVELLGTVLTALGVEPGSPHSSWQQQPIRELLA